MWIPIDFESLNSDSREYRNNLLLKKKEMLILFDQSFPSWRIDSFDQAMYNTSRGFEEIKEVVENFRKWIGILEKFASSKILFIQFEYEQKGDDFIKWTFNLKKHWEGLWLFDDYSLIELRNWCKEVVFNNEIVEAINFFRWQLFNQITDYKIFWD